MKTLALTVLACAISVNHLGAEVRMPAIFGDHMVLEQGMPIPVWGTAAPGEQIKISFGGEEVATKADAQGHWKTKLKPLAVTNQPRDFSVAGTNRLVFSDVIVGEVWVCSGQSNMVVSQRNMVSKEIEQSKELRFFLTPRVGNLQPQETSGGKWVLCENATWMENPYSAVGYYFAVEIRRARGTPVGMIQSAWGGTAIEPWIDLATYDQSASLRKVADQVRAQQAKLPEQLAKYEKEILPAWEQKHQVWFSQARSKPKDSSQAAPSETADEGAPAADKPKPEKEPARPAAPGRSEKSPTALFNAMVNPHIPYAMKGVLWYQGESNAQSEERSKNYAELMQALIRGWRARWEQGDFPFLLVQLPAFTVDRPWTTLRNSQLKALSLPNTGMAVALDLNPTDNLHPPRKQEVGRRLSLLARKLAYGENLVASGPLYRSMKTEGNKVRVAFTETGGGLILGGPPPADRKPNEDPAAEKALLGFQVCGADGVWTPAVAEIDGNSVVVRNDTVTAPVHVSYAWQNYPKANLYNKEGLPASPFRTDDLPDFLKAK